MSQPTDEELVASILEGECHLYSDLVRRYQGRVVNYLYRILHSVDDAHDLAQEVFLRVYKARGKYRPEARFRAWLLRIAINVVYADRRAWKRK